ncbi:MAG: response regulator transcription factor [Bacteroidetes bacterium]|nr:response regulator transcription factor [Bacteroidota bacterium]
MIKAIIIDDEDSCQNVLRELLNYSNKQVQILATAKTIDEGIKIINEHRPELVFLDVELKDKLSFEILEKVRFKDFYTIVTTAHEKYAMKAIKSSCLEFLLKPVDGNELKIAIEKFEKQQQISYNQKKIEVLLENIGLPQHNIHKLAIPCNDGYTFINAEDIVYCEADLKYTKIFTRNNENVLSSKNLGEFEELLNHAPFFRCHKSFIINVNFVKKYLRSDTQVIMSNGTLIDIASRKKDEFLKLFERI